MNYKINIRLLLTILFALLCQGVEAQNNMEVIIEDDQVTFSSSSVFGMRGSRSITLKPKDINSFQYLGGPFSKDKFHVYYKKYILEDADVESFMSLIQSGDYPELDVFSDFKSAIGVDSRYIYFMPTTGYYSESLKAQHVFLRKEFKLLHVLDTVNYAFFIKYQGDYYELAGDMYLRPEIRKYPFSGGYQHLGGKFIKSGNKIYNGIIAIGVADVNKFKAYGDSYYFFDGESIFYKEDYSEVALEDPDFASFEVHPVVDSFARDDNKFYIKGSTVNWDDKSKLVDLFNNKLSREEMLEMKNFYKR